MARDMSHKGISPGDVLEPLEKLTGLSYPSTPTRRSVRSPGNTAAALPSRSLGRDRGRSREVAHTLQLDDLPVQKLRKAGGGIRPRSRPTGVVRCLLRKSGECSSQCQS